MDWKNLSVKKDDIEASAANQSWLPDALGEIRQAVRDGQIKVYYQLQVDLASGRPCGVEMLARWMHPVCGMIMPDQFIAVAEQDLATIRCVTFGVIQQMFADDRVFCAAGLDLNISLNLSALLLNDADFPVELARRMHREDFDPRRLMLEITETAEPRDLRSARVNLNQLRDLGVSLSVDDFGTGFSSFAELYESPFTELKIDKSLIMDASRNYSAATVVRNIISLAHELGLRVVAEGIEDEAADCWLSELECDIGQGYYYNRPMPLASIIDTIHKPSLLAA